MRRPLLILLCFLPGFLLIPCDDPSYCKNGGICTLSSTIPAAKRCKENEVFHEDSCFLFNPKPLNWTEAAKFCVDRESVLPVPQKEGDVSFLSAFTQGSIDGATTVGRGVEGVWTGVRSHSNGSTPAWVSYPGSFLVPEQLWKPGEPNLYPNWNDVCVSLQKDTLYRAWQSETCETFNYVICQRNLATEEKNFVPQCSCTGTNFEGSQCEIPSAEGGDSSSVEKAVCSSEPFLFSCPNGETIVVDFASFGAVEGQICSTANLSPHTCSNPHSLQTMINKCQGLPFCEIPVVEAVFPETGCPVKQELQLQYRMRCTKEVTASCSSGSFYNSGRCFSIIFNSDKGKGFSRDEAAEKCRQQGGQLPSGIVAASQTELSRQIQKKTKIGDFWIDLKVEMGEPKWSDGTTLTYTPDQSTLSPPLGCAVFSLEGTMATWKTVECQSRANYICEFPPQEKSRPTQDFEQPTEEEKTVFKGDGSANEFEDIFGETKYCPEETSKGVFFPRTRVCMEAREPCPDPENIIGTVVRYCNCKSLKWDPPNTTNCTHKWVSEVRAALDQGQPAERITRQLADNLGRTVTRQLYGGDILGSVALSDDVLSLAKNQYALLTDRNDRQQRTVNFTQSLGNSGDDLLSPPAVPVWDELETWKRIEHASRLMSVLEQSALLLADYTVETKRNINYKNWAMEIEVREPESIGTTSRGGSMVLPGQAQQSPMDDTVVDRDEFRPFAGPEPSSVEFASLSKSPIITLPSLGTLKDSAAANNPPSAITGSTFFHPGGSSSASNLDRSRLRLGYFVFTTFGSLLSDDDNAIINSHIIGASVDDATRSISLPSDKPVTFTFYHLQKSGVSNPRCVFWNMELKQWSSEGCTLLSTNSESSECACTHLTSFAILMDVSGRVSRYSGTLASALDVVSIIGCAISIVCLSLSLIVFSCFRSLFNLRNTIHRNLCFCLLVAELVFVIGMDRTGNRTGCSVVALLLHFFFLASFCWMLLEGYQLYMMLIQVFEPNKTRLVLYYLFCYGFPSAVVAVSAGVAWHNYGTDTYCWIDTNTPTIWAFVIPIILVIIANTVFLLIALRVVLSVKSRDKTKSERVVGWLKGSAMLLCLLGITWVFGFLTAVNGGTGTVFAWIFTILNCTQGVFIFFLHVVMNEKVRSAVVRWIRTGICCLPDSSSAYNSRSYISSRQRIMNMVKAGQSQSHSDPSTASTDDKERQLTPNTKTNEWLRRISLMQNSVSFDEKPADEVHSLGKVSDLEDRKSGSSDPRGSQSLEVEYEVMEKQAPVKRKKFPLGVSENERGSTHRNNVVVERF